MPNVNTHCKISSRRTKGDEYRELHEWMDEGTKYLKHNHRLERHFFTQEYKDYIEEKWGTRAVVEWLFHIAIDNLETANKFASDIYGKIFDEITFKFDEKNIVHCDFIKNRDKSQKHFDIDLK